MVDVISQQGNASWNHNELPILLPLGWLESQSQIIVSVGEDIQKLEPFYTADRNIKWYNYLGQQSGIYSNDLIVFA